MSYFKQLVSKKKRRYKEGGFDLDLTYIKPNIVAMGFPSENIEGVYRNHMDEVYRFLEARHKDHYKVYNLCSERQYDPSKFHQRVATYPFDDHNAPQFELIKPFCDDLDEWLKANELNVAIVHCKAGKGRTGVMICAYLLHNKHFKEVNLALAFYGNARTRNSKGVTIPSQRRYVYYYGHLLRHKLQYEPTMVLLKALEIVTIPNMQNGTCCPFFILWQYKVKIHQSKIIESSKRGDKSIRLELSPPLPICGDIKLEFFHKEKFKKERMFQFWFNTFFISTAYTNVDVESTDADCDPTLFTFRDKPSEDRWFTIPKSWIDKAHKDEKCKLFPVDFKVKVYFSEVSERERPVPDEKLPLTENTDQKIKPAYDDVNCDDADLEMADRAIFRRDIDNRGSSNQREMRKPHENVNYDDADLEMADRAIFRRDIDNRGSSNQREMRKSQNTNRQPKSSGSNGSGGYQMEAKEKVSIKKVNESIGYQTEEEDDAMSDTDNEETWEQEGTLV